MAFFQCMHVPKITVDWTNARGYHAGHGNFTELGLIGETDFSVDSYRKVYHTAHFSNIQLVVVK